jgi:hypothetical protein
MQVIDVEGGYPSGEWPDKASQLLFDIGYSYALLRRAETMLKGLKTALQDDETIEPDNPGCEANRELRRVIGELLAQMSDFRAKRLQDRNELYKAGYLAGAKLESNHNEG